MLHGHFMGLWVLPGTLSREKHAVQSLLPDFFLAVTGQCGQQILCGQQSLGPGRGHLVWLSLTALVSSWHVEVVAISSTPIRLLLWLH